VLAACGAKPEPAIEAHAQTSWLASAQAAERGTGMARDYTKAAAIYATACNEGRGDVAACRRLIGAIGEARGVDRDVMRAVTIARAICARHDLVGCVVVAYAAPRVSGERDEEPVVKAELARDRDLGSECDRGDASACEAALAMQFPNFQGSSGVEEKQNALRAAACRAGVLDGCVALLEGLDLCRFEAGAARCADKLIAEWKHYEDRDHLDALDRVRGECDRGDAEACETLPGREIAYDVRCRAHDWGACAAMACRGDKAAEEQAKRHAAEANCTKEGSLAEARSAPPPRTRAVLPAEPALKVTVATRPPFHSLAFRRLATEPDSWAWPRFEMLNAGSEKVSYAHPVVYAYDAAGHQLARREARFGYGSIELASGGTFAPDTFVGDPLDPLPDAATVFEVCYDSISFASRGSPTTDSATCPEQRPRGGPAIGLDGEGSLAQLRWHAAAQPLSAHYAATGATPGGASALGEAALEAGTADFAGTDRPLGKPGTLDIPVLVTGVAVIYDVKGVDELRLSPATLAKIFQGEITSWNDPAIRRDNPRAKLPDEKILAMHEVGGGDQTTDLDGDAMRAVALYLGRAAHGAWRLGDPRIAWPEKAMRLQGLDVLFHDEGAIVFAELSSARAIKLARFARIKNAAGAFVAPTPEAMRAAAAEFAERPGPIEARAAAAYPLAYASWISVARTQHDPAHQPALSAYLKYLLGDGQALLEPLGMTALPEKVLAKSRASVDSL
jgi:phosphate transport system substrate-binding protein